MGESEKSGSLFLPDFYPVDGLNTTKKVFPGITEDVLAGAIKALKQMIAETATETETATEKPQQAEHNKRQQATARGAVN